MLSVADALAVILRHAAPLPEESLPLTYALRGLVLAEDVASDLDMPPFDKAMMDGFAVRTADVLAGVTTFRLVGEVTAGTTPAVAPGPGETVRIMTGAPVPAGVDAVIPVEQSRTRDAAIDLEPGLKPVRPGLNIMPLGRELRRGQAVLSRGTVLRPQEIGLLATVGRGSVVVRPRPVVAVLATGDELVEASETPGPGQIRNSNGPMIAAQVHGVGAVPCPLGIGRDRPDHLRPLLEAGLNQAMLVVSGGASAGRLDLVPELLKDLGVVPYVEGVRMKPGKPLFFGTRSGTLVFGLPGNPVSSLVCFALFVRPAIRRLLGHTDPTPVVIRAELEEGFTYPTDRPTYHPASLATGPDRWTVRLTPWAGSSDLPRLARANALVLIDPEAGSRAPGEMVTVIRLEEPE